MALKMLLARGGWFSALFTSFLVAGGVAIVCGSLAAWLGSRGNGFITSAVGLMFWCCGIIVFAIFIWTNPPPLRGRGR